MGLPNGVISASPIPTLAANRCIYQVRPSKSHITGPRQYESLFVVSEPLKAARKATLSERDRLLRSNGDMDSDSPDSPERASGGRRHNGPEIRGNRKKMTSIMGIAWPIKSAEGNRRSLRVASLPTRLKPMSVATKIHTHTSIYAPIVTAVSYTHLRAHEP